MTQTADSVLPDGLDFDDFADLADVEIETRPGPLSQSRTARNTQVSGTGKPRRRRSVGAKRLDALQKKLSSEMFQAGALTGLVFPVTGYYIGQESNAFTKAILQLAARRPEWLEALEHVADIGPGLTIGRTAIGIGASLAVDRDKLDPEKKALMFLGVYSAWQAVKGEGNNATEEGSAYVPPPGSFVPVG